MKIKSYFNVEIFKNYTHNFYFIADRIHLFVNIFQ